MSGIYGYSTYISARPIKTFFFCISARHRKILFFKGKIDVNFTPRNRYSFINCNIIATNETRIYLDCNCKANKHVRQLQNSRPHRRGIFMLFRSVRSFIVRNKNEYAKEIIISHDIKKQTTKKRTQAVKC